MKRMFTRRKRTMPELNTASLPDLIFTVLFFFMIVTHMRSVEPKVSYQVPQGSELQKVGHRSAVVYIYIGRAADGTFRVQMNNRLVDIGDIGRCIAEERRQMQADDQARMTVSIQADRDVPMGIVADVKKELRRSFALRVNYAATPLPDRDARPSHGR